MKLSEALKALIAKPDDLSTLPQLVDLAATMEANDETQTAKITTLYESNRKLLQMIPVGGAEEKTKEEPKVPSMKELAEDMIKEISKEDE